MLLGFQMPHFSHDPSTSPTKSLTMRGGCTPDTPPRAPRRRNMISCVISEVRVRMKAQELGHRGCNAPRVVFGWVRNPNVAGQEPHI